MPYLAETRVVQGIILMTNAQVVLWEVKVSGEVGSFRTPADMLHEGTSALDATLSVPIKSRWVFECQTFQAPAFCGWEE